MSKSRVNFLIPSELLQEIYDISKRDDRSVAEVIREACREHVYRDRKKGISKFYEDKSSNDIEEGSKDE